MAERRMFAKTIIDSDAFLDMPLSSQALYFHLSMRADDDGFINNPRKIQRIIGCGNDDLKLLIAKKFIIPFDSGVCVIKHWRIHNYLQKDRYKETMYIEEKSQLDIKKNKAYTLKKSMDTECIQGVYKVETPCIQNGNNEYTECEQNIYSEKIENDSKLSNCEGLEQCIHHVYKVDTQVRLGKDSIGKSSIEKEKGIETRPLSFPTPIHEQIFNQFGEVSYKTWLSNLDITDDEIVIYAANKPFEDLIKKRYVDAIETLTGKTVSVKGKEVS
ncbi:DnaA N-terminal domain-containing protein [Clostridium sp.]|uniref:DnaA N-terminal domain-containing protein n=1 Tax=Clostridium sp. TaxID=1506 RepID=UPI00291242B2|nr:DnaA N-terminal domain-containing protein [Clostridium sp.]MDU4846167.1 DnaA N-terminal domain-containing protein [Clostridium sp.]